jgi:hypothetical protein
LQFLLPRTQVLNPPIELLSPPTIYLTCTLGLSFALVIALF